MPTPGADERPLKSAVPFLIMWFLLPMAAILLLTALDIPQRLSDWVRLRL